MIPRTTRKNRRGPGSRWFGSLRAAVKADRQQRGEPPDLSENDVLAWADAFLARTGDWPMQDSGPIPEAPGETWLLVEASLAFGLRGFARGGSLTRFLADHRGRYNRSDPSFSFNKILAWADDHQARTGEWPTAVACPVPGAGGVTWLGLDEALRLGRGGLPGDSTLVRLLAVERGVVQHVPLTEEQILVWADAYHARTGRWPNAKSGLVSESPDETWAAICNALELGRRSLAGGSSLAKLFVERRGGRSKAHLPPLTISQVLGWADAFHARTGEWPTSGSGTIAEAPGESWRAVDDALGQGSRGLPRGWSLIGLLANERGVHKKAHRPGLTITEILRWVDAHHDRCGTWPRCNSGAIPESPGDTWRKVQVALTNGNRGLEGGSSLARLLEEHRGRRHPTRAPDLTTSQILAWASAFHIRTGKWPGNASGPIPEAPGETWSAVSNAIQRGSRGLPRSKSLTRLLVEHLGKKSKAHAAPLTTSLVLAWADAHHARTGRWPTALSGPVAEAPGQTWCAVQSSLVEGTRGLPGGSSLFRLLAKERGACITTNRARHAMTDERRVR